MSVFSELDMRTVGSMGPDCVKQFAKTAEQVVHMGLLNICRSKTFFITNFIIN